MNHWKTNRRFQRVMNAAEAQEAALNPALLRQLRAQGVIPPIAGGSPEADGDHAGEGSGKPNPGAKTGEADDDNEADDGVADKAANDDNAKTASKGRRATMAR